MYFYSLYGWEENTIICNEKKFTEKKFQKMCEEAPLLIDGSNKWYDTQNIIEYLFKKYGFKELKTETGFFVNEEIN